MRIRSFLVGLFAVLAIGALGAVAQNIQKSFQLSQDPTGLFNVDTTNNAYFPAHLNTAGSAGTLSSCGTVNGTTTPSQSGSDLAGTIQTGTSTTTSCQMTFRTAYTSTPYCVVNAIFNNGPVTTASAAGAIPSTAGVTFTYGSALQGSLLNYTCMGRSTG